MIRCGLCWAVGDQMWDVLGCGRSDVGCVGLCMIRRWLCWTVDDQTLVVLDCG
jgi:hypothetical protein